MVYIPSENPLEKTHVSFVSGCQLQTASWLAMGAHVYSPSWRVDFSGLNLWMLPPALLGCVGFSFFSKQPNGNEIVDLGKSATHI